MKKMLLIGLLISSVVFAEDEKSLIAVNGTVEKSMDPNLAYVMVEVYAKAAQAQAAQALQAKEYIRFKSIVEKNKIKKEDFTSENFSMTPEYFYDQKTQTQKITGYRVSHQIKLTVRKVDDLGSILDQTLSSQKPDVAGISFQSVQWDSDKKSQLESTMLAEAVKVAQQKAEVLANAAGVKIKKIHFMTPSFSGESPVNFGDGMRAKAMMMESAPTQLNGGAIKVRADVQVQFEIQ